MKNQKIYIVLFILFGLFLLNSCSDNFAMTDEQAERIMEVLSSASYSVSNNSVPDSRSVEYKSGSVDLEEKSEEFTYRCTYNEYVCIHTDENGIQTEYQFDGVEHIDVSTPDDADATYIYIDIYTDEIDAFSITGGDINSTLDIALKYEVYVPSEENSWEGSYICTGTINGKDYIEKPGSLFSIEFVGRDSR